MTLLTSTEAAEILGVKNQTLTHWRWAKTGPSYHRIGGVEKGAIRYSMEDLQSYINRSRIVPQE